VVHQTALMQLIQYQPTTQKCTSAAGDHSAVDQQVLHPRSAREELVHPLGRGAGHTVFVLSWVNPDARLAQKGFDDYMREGALAAFEAVEKVTGEREVNAIGYCLGGTLLGLRWAT
jgi:polyhydroxyalkanoate synthase